MIELNRSEFNKLKRHGYISKGKNGFMALCKDKETGGVCLEPVTIKEKAVDGKVENFYLKLSLLRNLITFHYNKEMRNKFPDYRGNDIEAVIKDGKKYIKIDLKGIAQTSGKYMIEKSTGKIFGIKGYGVINRVCQFGDLNTILEYNWGGYYASKNKI